MRKLLAILFLLIAIPAFAEDKLGGVAIYNVTGGGMTGTVVPNPTTNGQFLGAFSTAVEWETLTGGTGNCSFTRTGTGTYALNCPGYISSASPTFTGTVTLPDLSTWNSTGLTIKPAATLTGPDLGTWTSTGFSNTNVTTTNLSTKFVTVQSGGSIVIGSTTWNASGITGLASLTLTSPLAIGSGGLGNATPPTTGQILVAQSTTQYAPETMSGDATISTTGVVTVSKVNGQTLGAAATLGVGTGLVAAGGNINLVIPVPVTSGGLGTNVNPLIGNIPISQGNGTYQPHPIGGDLSITAGGFATVTQINGQQPGGACPSGQAVIGLNSSAVPTCGPVGSGTGVPAGTTPQFVGYTSTGAPIATTLAAASSNGKCALAYLSDGTYYLNCPGYISANNPVFTGVVTMPDGAKWGTQGVTGGTNFAMTGFLQASSIQATTSLLATTGTFNNLTVTGICNGCGNLSLGNYLGPVSITGNQTNGSDQVSNVNVNGVINVKTYGAKGDGVTDDWAAIMAAKAASGPGATKCLYFPAGTYMIKSTLNPDGVTLNHDGLNFTNNSDPNTWSFCAFGDNMFTSAIKCSMPWHTDPVSHALVRSGHACFDALGADGFYMHDMEIVNGTSATDAAWVALLVGRTKGGFQGFGHTMRNIFITGNDPGSKYSLYNHGAEVGMYYNVRTQPGSIVISQCNSAGMTSAYQTIDAGGTSMSLIHFFGGQFFPGTGDRQCGVIFDAGYNATTSLDTNCQNKFADVHDMVIDGPFFGEESDGTIGICDTPGNNQARVDNLSVRDVRMEDGDGPLPGNASHDQFVNFTGTAGAEWKFVNTTLATGGYPPPPGNQLVKSVLNIRACLDNSDIDLWPTGAGMASGVPVIGDDDPTPNSVCDPAGLGMSSTCPTAPTTACPPNPNKLGCGCARNTTFHNVAHNQVQDGFFHGLGGGTPGLTNPYFSNGNSFAWFDGVSPYYGRSDAGGNEANALDTWYNGSTGSVQVNNPVHGTAGKMLHLYFGSYTTPGTTINYGFCFGAAPTTGGNCPAGLGLANGCFVTIPPISTAFTGQCIIWGI